MFKQWVLCCAMICSMALMRDAAATSDEQDVAAAVETMRVAMQHPVNRAALDQLAMPELTYGHSHGKLQNKAEFIEALTNGSSDFIHIDLSDQTVKVVGDVALVRHTLTAVTNDSGKPGNVTLKILLVWKKDGDRWRLLARQAVHPD